MIAIVFLVTCILTIGLTIYRYKYGYYLFLFCFFVYPRILSIGIGAQGFVLSMPRAQLIILAIILFFRLIWIEEEYTRLKQTFSESKFLILLPLFLILWKAISSIVFQGIRLDILSGLVNDLLFGLVLILVTATAIKKISDLSMIAKILFVGLFINFIGGLIEYFMGNNLFQGVDYSYATVEGKTDNISRLKYGEFRIQAFFSNPLLLAFVSALSFPFLLQLINRNKNSYLYYTSLIIIPVMIYLTKSRGALLLLFLIFAGFYFLKFDLNIRQKLVKRASIIFLIVISGVTVLIFREELFLFINLTLFGRNISLLEDRSALERISQFFVFQNVSPTVFLFGLGRIRYLPAITDAINHLDNYLIRTFLESGIIGLSIFLSYLYLAFKEAWYIINRAKKYNFGLVKGWGNMVLLVVVITFLVCNLTSNTIINLFIYLIPTIILILKRHVMLIESFVTKPVKLTYKNSI